ncbi:MAG: desulfoferrodoxin [Clostridiales bacterium]|nr:desulfoferrodoxin [Clostridiales bacterium]
MKFMKCNHCGNIVAFVEEKQDNIICCGEKMEMLIANTVDASVEKHAPVVTVQGDKVDVVIGENPHPMLPEHYIGWVVLETKLGNQRKILKNGEPSACFKVCSGDKFVRAYAYCNLHGLWETKA